MRNLSLLILIILSACTSNRLPKVEIVTKLGNIVIEVDTIKAPVSAKNFLKLVTQGVYNDAAFYRVVRMDNQPNKKIKIEVIQGGLQADSLVEKYAPIRHETTQETGLKHLDGTISMARNEPGTASTEFFICIGNQPELDFGGKRNPDGQGFAAFGKIVKGMSVIRKIQQGKDSEQMLICPIKFKAHSAVFAK